MIDKNDIMACLKDLLEDKADFALLFGSWAGEGLGMTAESDVDCGVFFCPQVAADKSWWELPDRFEMRTGLKLDLVCLNTADIIIASQIVVSGEPVFVHSQERLVAWQAQVMSRYIDFKQSRKIIEQNILVRPGHDR